MPTHLAHTSVEGLAGDTGLGDGGFQDCRKDPLGSPSTVSLLLWRPRATVMDRLFLEDRVPWGWQWSRVAEKSSRDSLSQKALRMASQCGTRT